MTPGRGLVGDDLHASFLFFRPLGGEAPLPSPSIDGFKCVGSAAVRILPSFQGPAERDWRLDVAVDCLASSSSGVTASALESAWSSRSGKSRGEMSNFVCRLCMVVKTELK